MQKNYFFLLFLGIFLGMGSGLSAQLTPVTLGRASNLYTTLNANQNQVVANNATNSVAFIHRQDVAVWGGGGAASGLLRYDYSTDGGATFNNDLGPLNPLYTQTARYPQISLYNPTLNTTPSNAKVIFTAATLGATTWDGMLNGVDTLTTSAPPTSENYSFNGAGAYIGGGLCQSNPTTFWSVDFNFNGTTNNGPLHIYRGNLNTTTSTVAWTNPTTLNPSHKTNLNSGNPIAIDPNIAFSPNGNNGWVAWLGDLNGGHDSTVNPIFVRSTNGGTTWGSPIEVDLRSIPWIDDSLTSFWTQAGGAPAGSGNPTTAFDMDLTVDVNGNPHMLVVVGNKPNGATYSISSGIEKFIIDLYSTNGGITWNADYIAPILTFRLTLGTTPNEVLMDNQPQISRTEDGSKIFFSWVDSDTSVIGFGEQFNLAPNLIVAGKRISDGFRTCYRSITRYDATWNGAVLFPAMSPTVFGNSNLYELPITVAQIISGTDPTTSTQFYYFGNDVNFTDADFVNPNTLNLSFTGTCNCVPPVSSFTTNNSGNTFAFTNTSSGASSYSWNFGDGSTSTQQSPTHTFTSPGLYNVCVTSTSTCGSQTKCNPVCVAPTSVFTQSTSGLSVNFSNSSNGTSYSWDFGDGNTSNQTSPSHTYSVSGTYQVCLTSTVSCTTTVTCTSVTVNCPVPNTSFSQSISGTSVTFSDQSSNSPISWSWDFGDGAGSSLQNPTHSYSGPGTYTVCLITTNSCGNDTTCLPVTISCSAPSPAFTYSVSGNTASFTDQSTGGATTYTWDFGDGSFSTLPNPTHTYTNQGIYTVCLIAGNSCGNDTICQSVNVCTLPASAFTYSVTGLSATFTDNSTDATSWLWDFGNGNFSTNQSPTVNYAAQGTYTVCLVTTNACGSDTTCQTVNICTLPASSFTFSATGLTVSFTDGSSDATTWLWDFGNGNFSTAQSPSVTYSTTGNYTVCLTTTNSCGSDTLCQNLTLTSLGEGLLREMSIYPNPGSGIFHLEGEFLQGGVYELRVLDALGREVRATQTLQSGGSLQETIDLSSQATGVYLLELKGKEGREFFRLIRQ